MLGMMKLIADFARFKSTALNENAQKERLEFYMKDDAKYMEIIMKTLQNEEKNYHECTGAVLTKLGVTKELFYNTERKLMSDPLAQMELMEKGVE